ncbi:MAG TPA: hypothetical protein VF764_12815 [Steroidobacteraceae bacterium]
MSDPFRDTYRALSEAEVAHVAAIKKKADEMLRLLDDAPVRSANLPDPRAQAIAKTKLEECVMWAVKAVT